MDYDFKSSMIFLEIEENLSINKTDEKGVIKVTKEEALKYVVAFAVCTVGGLSCEDWPFNGMESCLPLSDEIIHDVVTGVVTGVATGVATYRKAMNESDENN